MLLSRQGSIPGPPSPPGGRIDPAPVPISYSGGTPGARPPSSSTTGRTQRGVRPPPLDTCPPNVIVSLRIRRRHRAPGHPPHRPGRGSPAPSGGDIPRGDGNPAALGYAVERPNRAARPCPPRDRSTHSSPETVMGPGPSTRTIPPFDPSSTRPTRENRAECRRGDSIEPPLLLMASAVEPPALLPDGTYPTCALIHLVPTDFGRVIDVPIARLIINCESIPWARDTLKRTV